MCLSKELAEMKEHKLYRKIRTRTPDCEAACRYAGWCKVSLAEIVAFLTAIGKATADNKSGLLLPKHQLKYNSSPLLRQ